jgi:hypothetical protein
MLDNLYALERLSQQKQIEIEAEVHRDHVGADVAHASRHDGAPFSRRFGTTFFSGLFSAWRTAAPSKPVANIGNASAMSD